MSISINSWIQKLFQKSCDAEQEIERINRIDKLVVVVYIVVNFLIIAAIIVH